MIKSKVTLKVNLGYGSENIKSYAVPKSFGEKSYSLFDNRIDAMANTDQELQTLEVEYEGITYYTLEEWFESMR